jgi:hypothetical protein
MSLAFLAVLFFLLAAGGALVAYGTAAKNRWGINLEAVSCPRCKTPLPGLREPRSLRQALWGGWTCPVCGAGVDKWGREVAPIAPPTVVKSEEEMGRVVKKRFVLSLPVSFCVMLLLDWAGVTGTGFPSTWAEALLQIVLNLLWTAILAVPLYFAWTHLLGRFPTTRKDRDPGQEHGLGGDPQL